MPGVITTILNHAEDSLTLTPADDDLITTSIDDEDVHSWCREKGVC